METEFEYSAFISYKREDEKWAIWLQNHLEHYSIPTGIRKEIPRLPKHIKPVFRDKTDLGAGGLAVSLHRELERSHFLLLVSEDEFQCPFVNHNDVILGAKIRRKNVKRDILHKNIASEYDILQEMTF